MDFINTNANIFFFTTTILVIVLIIIALVVLFMIISLYAFMHKLIAKGELVMEKSKDNKVINNALPIILPVLAFLFKYKSGKTKK